jgi:glycosyltransferase involved in cell wall biosynthesis
MCLESLYRQNIREDDYEVICINDYSPDHSREIVLEYQQQHSNLRLIEHTENKCLGGARNSGITAAQGKYLWFVDSDDKIQTNCLNKLIDICTLEEPDVVMFNFDKIDTNDGLIESVNVVADYNAENGIEFIHQTFGVSFPHHLGFVWRHLYRTDFLRQNQFYFPENVFWEDTVFIPKTLVNSKKTISIHDHYYLYRINPNSVSGIYNSKMKAELIYQFAFNTGYDLLKFSDTMLARDQIIADILHKKAIWYINQFTNRILKAPYREVPKFTLLVRQNANALYLLYPYMTNLNRFICFNPLGATTLQLLHFIKRIFR